MVHQDIPARTVPPGTPAAPRIIPANEIDYTDADEICGYQQLLCKIFERAGGFELPRKTNPTIREVQTQGLVWLERVKNIIEEILAPSNAPASISASGSGSGSGSTSSSISAPPSGSVLTLDAIPQLLGSYDFFYRVCHRDTCFDYLRRARLRAADRWVKGNNSISQTKVALMLRREFNRDIRTLEQRYIDFSGSVMTSWIDDLECSGRLRDTTPDETYDVLRYLLNENLFAYITDNRSKIRWIKRYTLSDRELDLLNTKTLWAYIGFDQTVAALTGIPLQEQDARYTRLFTKLSTRHDLHPFYRETIKIDLAKPLTA